MSRGSDGDDGWINYFSEVLIDFFAPYAALGAILRGDIDLHFMTLYIENVNGASLCKCWRLFNYGWFFFIKIVFFVEVATYIVYVDIWNKTLYSYINYLRLELLINRNG